MDNITNLNVNLHIIITIFAKIFNILNYKLPPSYI